MEAPLLMLAVYYKMLYRRYWHARRPSEYKNVWNEASLLPVTLHKNARTPSIEALPISEVLGDTEEREETAFEKPASRTSQRNSGCSDLEYR